MVPVLVLIIGVLLLICLDQYITIDGIPPPDSLKTVGIAFAVVLSIACVIGGVCSAAAEFLSHFRIAWVN